MKPSPSTLICKENLNPQQKREVERRLLALVTGKSSHVMPRRDKIDSQFILENLRFTRLCVHNPKHRSTGTPLITVVFSTSKLSAWINIPGAKFRTRGNILWKIVIITVEKLPTKIELLLGVIHRPIFELYKEIINAN